jgi:UDP-2,3-diacylglucosamine pyrophosphatase LpxH
MTLTLVVSDLHIASGRDPDSGKFSPLDDFYADEAFARFLTHYHYSDSDSHLVLNGDIFDLTQVVELPSPEEIPAVLGTSDLDADRRLYGLGHSALETCWKLSRVAAGHPTFFESLATWLYKGHHVHFVIGNHDPELRHPEAQDTLVEIVARAHPALETTDAATRIHFHAWYFYQPEQGLYAEHGGQYEQFSRVEDRELPSCYFNNRYLFNFLELRTPEADNIFPFSRYIFWLLSTDTLPTAAILARHMGRFLRARRDGSDQLPSAVYPNPRLPAHVEQAIDRAVVDQHKLIEQIGYRTTFYTITAVALSIFSYLSPLAAVALALTDHPILAILSLAAWPLSRVTSNSIIHTHLHRSLFEENDFLKEATRQLAPLLAEQDVRTVVFGHTHQPDMEQLTEKITYFNTGTWVPILPAETRLNAIGRTYLFVEIQDGEARLRRWDDVRSEPIEPTLVNRRMTLPHYPIPAREV